MEEKMNRIHHFACRTSLIVTGFLFCSLGVGSASGQSASELLSLFQNLPSSTQQQLISQLTGGTSTDTTTDTDTTTTDGESLPLGTDAIDYVRTGSPGSQVRSATQGNPIPPITVYPPPTPEEDPDLWDRVKNVFVESLFQAFVDVTGLPINIPTAKSADETIVTE